MLSPVSWGGFSSSCLLPSLYLLDPGIIITGSISGSVFIIRALLRIRPACAGCRAETLAPAPGSLHCGLHKRVKQRGDQGNRNTIDPAHVPQWQPGASELIVGLVWFLNEPCTND